MTEGCWKCPSAIVQFSFTTTAAGGNPIRRTGEGLSCKMRVEKVTEKHWPGYSIGGPLGAAIQYNHSYCFPSLDGGSSFLIKLALFCSSLPLDAFKQSPPGTVIEWCCSFQLIDCLKYFRGRILEWRDLFYTWARQKWKRFRIACFVLSEICTQRSVQWALPELWTVSFLCQWPFSMCMSYGRYKDILCPRKSNFHSKKYIIHVYRLGFVNQLWKFKPRYL